MMNLPGDDRRYGTPAGAGLSTPSCGPAMALRPTLAGAAELRVIRSSAMASIVGGTVSERSRVCTLMTSSNLVRLCRGWSKLRTTPGEVPDHVVAPLLTWAERRSLPCSSDGNSWRGRCGGLVAANNSIHEACAHGGATGDQNLAPSVRRITRTLPCQFDLKIDEKKTKR
jgi:hypothetical protein